MSSKATRVPPQDIDMERALLGSLMLNQGGMYEVADLLGIDADTKRGRIKNLQFTACKGARHDDRGTVKVVGSLGIGGE